MTYTVSTDPCGWSELIRVAHELEATTALDDRTEPALSRRVAVGGAHANGTSGPDRIVSLSFGRRVAGVVDVAEGYAAPTSHEAPEAARTRLDDLRPDKSGGLGVRRMRVRRGRIDEIRELSRRQDHLAHGGRVLRRDGVDEAPHQFVPRPTRMQQLRGGFSTNGDPKTRQLLVDGARRVHDIARLGAVDRILARPGDRVGANGAGGGLTSGARAPSRIACPDESDENQRKRVASPSLHHDEKAAIRSV